MNLSGEQAIAASRDEVWQGLNDPEVLKRCIPGCQSLTKESDTRMVATVEIKIGPIGARFNGSVELADIEAPNSYTLIIEGQGGTVGSVKSIAKVRLTERDGGTTLLHYNVDAQVSGRLAQLGGPIMDATAKQLAARFFAGFGKVLAPEEATAAAVAPALGGGAMPPYGAASRGSPVAWLLGIVVAGMVGYFFGQGLSLGDGSAAWAGIAIGLLLLVVGAFGFEFGRRAAAPVITLDAALLAKLLKGDRP